MHLPVYCFRSAYFVSWFYCTCEFKNRLNVDTLTCSEIQVFVILFMIYLEIWASKETMLNKECLSPLKIPCAIL